MEKIPAVVKEGEIVACEACGANVSRASIDEGGHRNILFACGSMARFRKGDDGDEDEWELFCSGECKISVNSQRIDELMKRVAEIEKAPSSVFEVFNP